MVLQDIIKTKSEILEMGHGIDNNIITNIDVNVIAHFGNCTCFEIACTNVVPMCTYNNIKNLGYMIQAFVELFDLSEEDGIRISEIKNIPCRLIFENAKNDDCFWGCKCIGFGHFMKDKFVLTKDFVKVGLDEN